MCAVKCAKSETEYFTELLYDAMKGAGTNDDRLIRIIITRSEVSRYLCTTCYTPVHMHSLSSTRALEAF